MAKNQVFKFGAMIKLSPTIYQGNVVIVSYDDVTETFIVEQAVNSINYKTRTNASQITGSLTVTPGAISPYSYCSGTTKVTFESIATFPYAERIGVPGGCAPAPNPSKEIQIDLEIYDETLPGENDGRVVVNTVSLNPITLYQLTLPNGSQIDQTTNEFTGLAPGDYSIKVVASNMTIEEGKVVYFTILAATLDSYGVYAQVHTGSIYLGYPILLQIRKRNYVGAVNEACFVGNNAVKLSASGSDTDFLFNPIYGLGLDFNLKAEYLRDWTILYTQDDREYVVDLYVSDQLVFRGYLMPEYLDQDFSQWGHTANFTASDGLGQLKDFDFKKVNGDKYTGYYTLREIIENCVNKVNLGIPVYSSINWTYEFDSPTPTYSWDLLGKLKVDVGLFYILFKSPSCANVVSTILTAFAARISQVNGVFVIEQPYNKQTSDTLTYFGKSGNLILNRVSVSGMEVTPPDDIDRVDNILRTGNPGTRQNMRPGVGAIIATETLQPIAGLVKNSNLQNYDYYRNTDVITRKVEVKDWFLNGVEVRAFFDATDSNITDVLPNGANVPQIRTQYAGTTQVPATGITCDGLVFKNFYNSGGKTKYITADLGYVNREGSSLFLDSKELCLLVYFKIKTQSIGNNIGIRIQVIWEADNGVNYYLAADNKSWKQSVSFRTYRIAKADTGTEKEFNFTTPVLPSTRSVGLTGSYPLSGRLKLLVSEPYAFELASNGAEFPGAVVNPVDVFFLGTDPNIKAQNILAIKQVQVKPLLGGFELLSINTLAFKNSGEFATKEAKIDIKLASHYYGRNNEYFYPYTILKTVDNKAPTYWLDEDKLQFTFPELAYRSLIKARQIPREVLEGTLKGRFSFCQRLQLVEDNNTEYFCTRWAYDVINDSHQVTLVYAVGFTPKMVLRVHEDGSIMVDENNEIIRRFERNRTYDEDFTTV